MKAKRVNRKFFLIFFLLIMMYVIAHATYILAKESFEKRIGVYSWHIEAINYDEFKDIAKKLKINSFYQYLSASQINSSKKFNELIIFLDSIGVNTYLLCGSSEYAYDDEISNIKQIIDEVARYNLNNEVKLDGVVLDVEFYLDSRYDEEVKQKCFDMYYKNMKKAYEYSKEKNVKLILVIPYWLDTEFGEESLAKLMKEACDSVEVMNYYKSKSAEHIESEIKFAKKYDKSIVTISELQELDENKFITEKITFYTEGLDASQKDMENILKKYKYNKLGYAYHYYEYLVELYEK